MKGKIQGALDVVTRGYDLFGGAVQPSLVRSLCPELGYERCSVSQGHGRWEIVTPGLGREMTGQERGGAGVERRPRILLTNSSMKAHVVEEES